MNENIRLGTIGRTRVGLNWSVVVIVALIAFALSSEFRYAVPGLGTADYLVTALLTAAFFLASLLGHELSHAFVARRRGVSVDGIVLWALGGVAKLNGDAPDAASELRIAIAGPLASLAFAVGFGLLALGFGAVGTSALLVTALWWLAEMNVALALFNLLPAYPLDGGRVLRAGLWRHWDDRLRATDAAAAAGGYLGIGLIGLGIFALVLVPALSLNGIWIALIGWFVLRGSRQERSAVRIASSLDGLCVGDVMHPVPFVVPSYATIENLVEQYMRPASLDRCALVDFNGAVAGLVSLDHLGAVSPQQWHSTRASEVAWPCAALAQVGPRDALLPLVNQLGSIPANSALVWEEGRLVGTVIPRDVEQALRSPAVFRNRSHGRYTPVQGG
jgi:Zn-dependent protease